MQHNFLRTLFIGTSLLAILTTSSIEVYAKSEDHAAIRKAIIAESQANYPGNCPCPENRSKIETTKLAPQPPALPPAEPGGYGRRVD